MEPPKNEVTLITTAPRKSAIRNRRCQRAAPRRLRSSLSSSVSTSAAQLTFTKALSERLLSRWTARAMSSLPVPLSPVTKIVVRLGAAGCEHHLTVAHADQFRHRAAGPFYLRPRRLTESMPARWVGPPEVEHFGHRCDHLRRRLGRGIVVQVDRLHCEIVSGKRRSDEGLSQLINEQRSALPERGTSAKQAMHHDEQDRHSINDPSSLSPPSLRRFAHPLRASVPFPSHGASSHTIK